MAAIQNAKKEADREEMETLKQELPEKTVAQIQAENSVYGRSFKIFPAMTSHPKLRSQHPKLPPRSQSL
jgi:hypothetical protein